MQVVSDIPITSDSIDRVEETQVHDPKNRNSQLKVKIVHECLDSAGGQNIIWFLVTQGVYFLKKYDQLSESVVFSQKLRYFTEQNGPNWESHANEF